MTKVIETCHIRKSEPERPHMNTHLTPDERAFVDRIDRWDTSRRTCQWVLCNLSLVFSGSIFVAVTIYTVNNMNDRVIQWITLPSILVSIIFALFYTIGEQRLRERKLTASVVRKLSQQNLKPAKN